MEALSARLVVIPSCARRQQLAGSRPGFHVNHTCAKRHRQQPSSLTSSPRPSAATGAASVQHQSGSQPGPASGAEREVRPGVFEGYWQWKGYRIRYQRCGTEGPPVLCIHGFGANADHWRKNLPVLGQQCRAYAVDLLGYGYSDKPRSPQPNAVYNFPNWAVQLQDFIVEKVGEPAFITCNSVGGLAGLQTALDAPQLVRGVQIMNISLRNLHIKKQPAWQRPLLAAFQRTLRDGPLGRWFFQSLATPQSVGNVLRQCYHDPAAVTDELVDCILKPGLLPGAVDVFLDFISYVGGPLPEELLEAVTVPVSMVWGEEDPWEKIEWGRELAKYHSVEEFVSLPRVGHCPQDEAPHLVNPLILGFIERHSSNSGGGGSTSSSSSSSEGGNSNGTGNGNGNGML
ncbi:hypothetical protein N2152v2_002326 [Parachlorella kessleri]